jgi:hypothetical protein
MNRNGNTFVELDIQEQLETNGGSFLGFFGGIGAIYTAWQMLSYSIYQAGYFIGSEGSFDPNRKLFA